MATKTVTTYICDRCEHEAVDADDTRVNEAGSCNITYTGHEGGRTWQGDWGGGSYSDKAWLCLDCSRKFIKFMHNN